MNTVTPVTPVTPKMHVIVKQTTNARIWRIQTKNGKTNEFIGKSDIERFGSLLGYASYLRSINCDYTANKIVTICSGY